MRPPSEIADEGRRIAIDLLAKNKADATAKLLLECATELKTQIRTNLRLEETIHQLTKEEG